MKVNMSIPGWNERRVLNVIGYYASKVPENGVILELGGFFGRTSYVLGHNKHPSVKMTTIDWWITYHLPHFEDQALHDGKCGQEGLDRIAAATTPDPDRIEGEDFFQIWKDYMVDVPNHTGIRHNTIYPHVNFPMIDFIYHDAGHSYEEVLLDLRYWGAKLKQDGIIILDDYDRKQFPGLCEAVDDYAIEQNFSKTPIFTRNMLLKRNDPNTDNPDQK